MKGFEWDGEFFPAVPPAQWTIGEARALERYVGATLSEMSNLERAACMAFVAVKRCRHSFTWPEIDNLPMSVLLDIAAALTEDDEPEVEPEAVEDTGEVLSPTNGASG